MARPRIAYVTAGLPPGTDGDLPFALAAMEEHGLDPQPVAWDADIAWDRFAAAVIRSPWDYPQRREEFLAWAQRVAAVTHLFNPPEVLRTNTHKRYLISLQELGVAVVPTTLLTPADAPPSGLRLHVDVSAGPCVVKPAISAGAWDTLLTNRPDEAASHALRLLGEGRDVLVQPYLAEVAAPEGGEISVVVIDGAATHAARKIPPLTAGGNGNADRSVPLTADLELAARSVLEAAHATDLLYARVDLVLVDHTWTLMELELTEPSLYLHLAPGAGNALAQGLRRRL